MSKAAAIDLQLDTFRIDSEEQDSETHETSAFLPKLKRLPPELRAPAFALLDLDEKGKELPSSWQEPEKWQTAHDKVVSAQFKLDKMPAAKRRKIFTCFAPSLATEIEQAWQHLKSAPYRGGYMRCPFHASKKPAATLPARVAWFASFARCIAGFDPQAITLPWLAQWAPHAFPYEADCVVPLLTVAIDNASPTGDEVFEILRQTVTREHAIGIMGEHVIGTLLDCKRAEGWELMEKTLLAAQRQEGLRQQIVQRAGLAHPDAFQRMLRLILDQNLVRFSSVGRSINLWFGLLWDSVSSKIMTENVEAILLYLDSEPERTAAIASNDAETVYRGLWAMAYLDAPTAVPHAAKLLKHPSDEIRYVATWILTLIGLEESSRAKLVSIADENLQVALLAAVNSEGVAVSEDAEELFDDDQASLNQRSTFPLLEQLYTRMPEKPKKLPPIVWPWTERTADRKLIAGCLLRELGDRPATTLLPYLKGFDSWQHRSVIDLLSQQKKWDKLTRATLFELAGHSSSDVREAAFAALKYKTPDAEERLQLEGYLNRTATDLRLSVVDVLLTGSISDALESADRLLADGTRNRRLAGLEMLRQLAVTAQKEASEAAVQTTKPLRGVKKKTATKRKASAASKSDEPSGVELRIACQTRAAEYRAARKKLTNDEQLQLDAIDASDREVYSLDNALGLMDPAGRSPVVAPVKKKVLGISPAAIACLKDLDDLVHKHRKEIVRVKNWQGYQESPLGELNSYDLPDIDPEKPMGPQRAKFPLLEVWEEWKAKRTAKLKDKDGLELLRAMLAASLFNEYRFDRLSSWTKKPANKKIAVSVLGELNPPKLRYDSLIAEIVEWLLYLEIPKGCVDYLLDCTENTFAHIPAPMLQTLVELDDDHEDDYGETPQDWRSENAFTTWDNFLQRFLNQTGIRLSKPQLKRQWQLRRFRDEPLPGAKRDRMPLDYVVESFQNGLATFDDIADVVLGPKRNGWRKFGELSILTHVPPSKSTREMLANTAGLSDWLDRARGKILEIELARGEAETVATDAALGLQGLQGIDTLTRIMATLGGDKFKIVRRWGASPGQNRAATLTHLISITHPSENDTPAEFSKQMSAAIKQGYCDTSRLLELAFLAPQWTKFVEAHLRWDGFAEGLYWFIAHMSNWDNSAQLAAAGAEGIEDEAPEELDDDYDFDRDEEEDSESDSIPKPQPLSAWERLVLERTPLTQAQRSEGAVDVDWFQRTWQQLGAKRWQGLADAAKFSANSAQARKAQFLADVLLGKAKKKDLVDGIKKRNLKDNVRLLGLLPLAKGAQRDKDLMDRYNVLLAYKKYARGLSGLTKPDAFRALDIGFANLARLAGYRDPLRLEWALEAESVKDLATGPVSVSKEGLTVTLSLDESAKPQLTVSRGDKPLKSIPAPMKKKHAAIRDLAERGKELRSKSSRVKQSLEAAMCRGDAITGSELAQLMQHAILAPQLSRLVLVGEGIMGYPDKGGKVLRDEAGKLEPVKKNETLRIAHPADLLASKKWDRWQRECFQAERVQPFKQIFRELYVVTSQEKKDGVESSRFAGQQIGPRQAMALWNSRGWNTQDAVFKTFHELSLVAEVNFQWDYGTAAEIEGLTLETIQFRRRDEFRPIKLSAVPANVFSEVMRDIDLVVSVAHRGEVDPEASASTVEMRAMLIAETCQLLGLKNVQIKKSHALIAGHYGEYSLHLGSGNVQRIPGGALAILPVHAQHRGRLFLPFADDDPRTAEVISKVLLLARDEEIQDPMILDQLAVPKKARRAIVAYAELDKPKRGKPTKKKSSVTKAAEANKLRYELSEGKSNKFWEISISDNTVTTTWGRIGSGGQTKTKTFEDAAAAQIEYDRLIADKTKKGYQTP
ncbi:DUF5724 domain-containing protein [Rosistilla oblonga]|uniref:DUF5724 domain-containing protein n=1 Tax=Rosistilla oblonga TaxID=2527990 RepID=UPI003A971C2A